MRRPFCCVATLTSFCWRVLFRLFTNGSKAASPKSRRKPVVAVGATTFAVNAFTTWRDDTLIRAFWIPGGAKRGLLSVVRSLTTVGQSLGTLSSGTGVKVRRARFVVHGMEYVQAIIWSWRSTLESALSTGGGDSLCSHGWDFNSFAQG
jgi:hypothetical protein